jgi:tetratricopeptide (TPR) repeat protein
VDADERSAGWQRISRLASDGDALTSLQELLVRVRFAPANQELRRQLRAIASLPNVREQATAVLAQEVRTSLVDEPAAAGAFLEVLVRVYELLDRPVEAVAAMEQLVALAPDNVEHLLGFAARCLNLGAWAKAAETFERVSGLGTKEQACAALRAAAKLYRENARPERAADAYRAILDHRPADKDAANNVQKLYEQLGRWRDLADLRGELAKRATNPVDKASRLRAQARALEQAGDVAGAADVMATAARYMADDISGLLDYADVLARSGQGREAADLLAKRVSDAIARRASVEEISRLRVRHAALLEDACGDRAGAAAVLDALLRDCPTYAPALERVAWHASHDPNASVHAAALERYAAAIDDPALKATTYVEAARRYRDAEQRHACARALEQVLALLPQDATLRAEYDEVCAALDVERASSEVLSGDLEAAERRLRSTLASRPHDVHANVALADVLVARNDLEGARELLHQALATAPDALPKPQLAPLAHKYALVISANGDDEEAHRMLHEAHLLDRHSLPITLALGASCFARKLWRQAIVHLAPLADHPDAPRHAARVAEALVLAGQAEARALRPANAIKHYEAAIRLDPDSPAAWHALAAMAMERGDVARAVDCFEREALATKSQIDRERLLDALGDLAHDVLHDSIRAEQYWSKIVDADASILHKLLAVQRRRDAEVEVAETCLQLAAVDVSERKVLLQEAAERFAAIGDFVRARAAAERLIEAHPLDVDAVSCASSVVLSACDADAAATWLHRALEAWHVARRREPREAELWQRLGDAERSRQRPAAARAAYERAIASAPSADSPDAIAARRALMALTPKAARTLESLEALVEADPSPDEVVALARAFVKADRVDDARAAFDLAMALNIAVSTEDKEFLAQTAPRVMGYDEAYGQSIDEQTRRDVIDEASEGILGSLLDVLGEALALLVPDPTRALRRAGLAEAARLSVTSNAAFAAMYPQVSKALAGPPTLLFSSPDVGDGARVLLASPPVIVIGSEVVSIRGFQVAPAVDATLRFICGSIVELTRPRRVLAAGGTPEEFELLLDALWHAFGPQHDASTAFGVAEEAKRLHSALPVAMRRRIGELIAEVPRQSVDARAYITACTRAADRSGLLACGDAAAAIEASPAPGPHLIRFAASRGYRRGRRALRTRR